MRLSLYISMDECAGITKVCNNEPGIAHERLKFLAMHRYKFLQVRNVLITKASRCMQMLAALVTI